ncbi:hypothetical protein [Granulicella sp. dw_53]|uniref:hypothetical protein n=1 Tax=Granulicella sp. dw_53 TaxID=2719792 RepID=UPI001BD2288B|nr:hypothetical protein [Granulicella sp. dw_53]
MVRRVLVIVAVLIVVGLLYRGYSSYDAGRTGTTGSVYSNDPPAAKASATKDKESTETTPTENAETKPVESAIPPNQAAQPESANAATPPANDTINPNPPNGMVFSGTGHFQLYRQGNITWRLNTDTGQSCVLFATDEEWKKPRVLHAACGKT